MALKRHPCFLAPAWLMPETFFCSSDSDGHYLLRGSFMA